MKALEMEIICLIPASESRKTCDQYHQQYCIYQLPSPSKKKMCLKLHILILPSIFLVSLSHRAPYLAQGTTVCTLEHQIMPPKNNTSYYRHPNAARSLIHYISPVTPNIQGPQGSEGPTSSYIGFNMSKTRALSLS